MQSSIRWVYYLRISERATDFLRTYILARLLEPSDYGIFALAYSVVSFLDSSTNLGLEAQIIKEEQADRKYINTVWTISLLRSAAVVILILFLSSFCADFFKVSQITIVVLSSTVILRALSNPGVAILVKEFNFKKYFLFRYPVSLSNVFSSIFFGFIFRDFNALVFATIVGSIFYFVMSYLVHDFRPSFCFEHSKSIIRFGGWLAGINTLSISLSHIDVYIIGKILGAENVGIYSMARNLASLAIFEFASIIGEFAFPLFAKVRREAIQSKFSEIVQFNSIVSSAILVTLIFYSNEIIILLLSKKWYNVPHILSIVLISFYFISNISFGSQLFITQNKPNIFFFGHLVRLLTLATLLPIFANFGLKNATIAILIASTMEFVIFYIFSEKMIKNTVTLKNVTMYFKFPLISFVCYLSAFILLPNFQFSFILKIFVGILLYIIVVRKDFKNLLKNVGKQD